MQEQKPNSIDKVGSTLFKHQPFRWLLTTIFMAQIRFDCWRVKRDVFSHVKHNFTDLYLDWKDAVLELATGDTLHSTEELHSEIRRSIECFFGEIIHPREEFDMGEIVLGSKVTIKECHSMPQIIGKTGTVKALLFVDEHNKYPLSIVLDEPVVIEQAEPIPGMTIGISWAGPYFCRPDELELVGETKPAIIPDAFNKAFKDEKPPETGTEGGAKT